MKSDFGWCLGPLHNNKVELGIHHSMPSRRIMLTTIAHEMVHQWQVENEYKHSHNKYFYQWRGPLSQVDIELKRWIFTHE